MSPIRPPGPAAPPPDLRRPLPRSVPTDRLAPPSPSRCTCDGLDDTPTPRSTSESLRALLELFPDHGNLTHSPHAWLRAFRDASAENRAAFDALFEGPDTHLHYRHAVHRTPVPAAAVRAVLDFYEASLTEGLFGEAPFRDGIVASFLGQLSPHLRVLGHHADDVLRIVRYALTGEGTPLYTTTHDAGAEAHRVEARTGLHLHAGRPMSEVGVVLAFALVVATLVDKVGRRLPWALQAGLKAAGAYPLFGHLVRGELSHALAHLREGQGLHELVKQGLVSALVLAGIVKRGGTHELAAGTVMASILAVAGHVQTDAAVRSFAVLRETLEGLPKSARVVHGDHVHARPVAALVPGESHIALRKGDTVPVDVTISALPGGAASVLVDSYRSRGQMSQRCTVGDRLDQGCVVLDDVEVHARVDASVEGSTLTRQIESQRVYVPSKRQSRAKQVGEAWVWATLGGTVLSALAGLIEGIDLRAVLARATSFATLASPCNILVSTLVEGATTRRLVAEGVVPIRGEAITQADQVRAYCFDFTGTCTVGAELAGVTFFDAAGVPVPEETAQRLFAEATALGMKAGSQHLKQKAMRRALFERLSPEEAQALAARPGEAREEVGAGVVGALEGTTIRVGKVELALPEGAVTDAQRTTLAACDPDGHSATYVTVGAFAGVLRFRDRLREGAKEAIAALDPQRVYVLTGDDNRAFVLAHTAALGIPDDHVFTGLDPEAKAARVKVLQREGKVAMVGDGLNDAAPMRAADVRYAMLDTAHDGILGSVDFLAPNLASIPPTRTLSRKVNLTATATLGFSVLYTALTAAAQATGLARLPVIGAAFAHEGVSGAIALLHEGLAGAYVRGFARERDALAFSFAPKPGKSAPADSAP